MLRPLMLLACLAAPGTAAQAATLVIRAQGIGSAQGIVYAGVCARSFDERTCEYRGRAAARPGTVEIRLPNVRPGRYAVAVYHDVNGNGTFDRQFFLPQEPYGLSNGIGRGSIPRIEDGLINVQDPSTVVVISVR